jgi:hypothetical protein
MHVKKPILQILLVFDILISFSIHSIFKIYETFESLVLNETRGQPDGMTISHLVKTI